MPHASLSIDRDERRSLVHGALCLLVLVANLFSAVLMLLALSVLAS